MDCKLNKIEKIPSGNVILDRIQDRILAVVNPFMRGVYEILDLFNDQNITWGTKAPVTGAWKRGDVCWNSAIASAVPEGWRCVVSGSPGTWTPMANHP